ncbi:MAG: hypothetical protein IIZ39_14130, partial [Blautia sp.]|nr:hypothetical protein [Blautia sp.]
MKKMVCFGLALLLVLSAAQSSFAEGILPLEEEALLTEWDDEEQVSQDPVGDFWEESSLVSSPAGAGLETFVSEIEP